MPSTSPRPRAVLLPPNPVWRSYVGGRVLRQFRGATGSDDNHFPEDWLASTVRARNGVNTQGMDEGLSGLELTDGNISLATSLAEHPEFWWGPCEAKRDGTGVLWKLLDSSVRLQLQAHPDAAFARQHLNSNAGKTECWYILGTRGEAYVYLGFQKSPGREGWSRLIREERVDEMLACFEPIPVRAGDCLVVPAGTPHAIGAGVFMMELQEPTDWVVRCERTNAGLRLPESACYMGLDIEKCLDVFDYESRSVAEVRRRWQQQPRMLSQTAGYCEEEIIAPQHHHFFRLNRLHGDRNAIWTGNELTLLVAITGQGKLATDGDGDNVVRAGETWLLPGSIPAWNWTSAGDWEILLAKTPLPPNTPATRSP